MTRTTYADRYAALYLTANYAFDRRYSVDLVVRYDGSNQLASDKNRWLPTWNFGAKWNIGNESFMEDVEWVNALGLRGSYGLVATMPSTSNSKSLFYNNITYAPGGYQESMVELQEIGNRNLSWEKLYQFNVGLEATLFDGRFDFSFDYFDRRSFDLIDKVRDSGIDGFTEKTANYADLYSHGFDVMLSGLIIKTNDWRWRSNLTFGYSTNTIRHAQTRPRVFDLIRQTGGNKNDYPVNSLFSLPYYGLVDGIPTYTADGGKGWSLQSLNTSELIYEGTVDPPFTGGWNNTVSWKGISLNVFVSYQWGNKIRLTPSYKTTYTDLDAMTKELIDRWVAYGDGVLQAPQLPDPVLNYYDVAESAYPYNNYNYSTARVVKGDFIRLKSLSLSYDLPTRWLEPTKVFRSANIRVTGKDLWLIYADKRLNGQDPEFFNTGGVALPALPQLIFSLNLTF